MKISPRLPAIIYLIVAAVLFYSALKGSQGDSEVFSTTTIILLVFSTYTLYSSIRLFRLDYIIKKQEKKK